MAHRYWPVSGIRLTADEIELRPTFGESDQQARSGRAPYQSYWSSLGSWRPGTSWLAAAWRGRGVGKAVRLAALALAFDALDAEVAETEAWHDNAASLGVSRSLGYVDNGIGRHARGTTADDMPRLWMTRDVWVARHQHHGVRVEGVAACRHMF